MRQFVLTILLSVALVGCERTATDIKNSDPHEDVEISMPRVDAATCVLRKYEATPSTFFATTRTLSMRDFPTEKVTELITTQGPVVLALVEIRGDESKSTVIVYRPIHVLPQSTNDRLLDAAKACAGLVKK